MNRRLTALLVAPLIAVALAAAAMTVIMTAATPAAAVDTIRTASGLRYADEKIGGGPKARPGQLAIVHYTGWLYEAGDKGKQFDTSRNGRPFSFRIGAGRVIRGWDEGVGGMRVGGKRVLIIPAHLGYGDAGGGAKIPPGATLYFEVELIDLR